MIPVRLTLLLIGFVALLVIILGNPEAVPVHFIFWSGAFELYKIIIGSMAFGVIVTVLYMGHVKYLRRVRSSRIQR